jgi:enoyl-CoA hydratase/carnithine racemase
MEMLLAGTPISAERACEIGLVNRVVPPEALDAEVSALATLVASKSPMAIATGKQVFYRQLEMPLGEAYAVAGHAIACDFVGEEGKEGLAAFLDKRAPRWSGRS